MQDPPVKNNKPQMINFKELNKWRNVQWSQVRSPSKQIQDKILFIDNLTIRF